MSVLSAAMAKIGGLNGAGAGGAPAAPTTSSGSDSGGGGAAVPAAAGGGGVPRTVAALQRQVEELRAANAQLQEAVSAAPTLCGAMLCL